MNTMPTAEPLSLSIKDRAVLYTAYMSCVRHGGLFIPTSRPSHIGEEIVLLLDLMDEAERIPVKGRIIWITPRNTQDNRTQGVGIQFTEANSLARTKIETYLAGVLASERPTHTM
ncbi:type IV pilus assembly protein PilZ [Azomonas agilis]|uniref:Type IV pilus assembly protein PilZ n=1 Tax=Azomonas agilis TaxID=116849 RepID=A0A562IZZ3_9GAMM|nr:PilZ domain-containing protein [Azomonas agilis]TWH76518.1 type IV pilus assembly protein PilZ [Azomonas agilis]